MGSPNMRGLLLAVTISRNLLTYPAYVMGPLVQRSLPKPDLELKNLPAQLYFQRHSVEESGNKDVYILI